MTTQWSLPLGLEYALEITLPHDIPIPQLYLWQMLSGINYCHSRRILHRDMKPQNLLVDQTHNQVTLPLVPLVPGG